jgi:Raf kinase inhibitor-like YbhB/YbcL family protein
MLTAGLVLASFAGPAVAAPFELASPDVKNGGVVAMIDVFNGAGCAGGNMSPALHWANAPAETKSYAVTVFDPDAGAAGFWHWGVFDIPATVSALPRNAGAAEGGMLPEGAVQIRNDFGTLGYGGPCPPQGVAPHHYIFTVYGLDVAKLPDLSAATPAAALSADLHEHMLAFALLVASYP